MSLLGIDIGGTKTAVCVGTRAGRVLAADRMATRGKDPFASYLPRLRDLCRKVMSHAGVAVEAVRAVGIAAPGPMSVRKGMLYAPPNNPGWKDVPIVQALVDAFGRPVFLNNDANAAALAEFFFGECKGAPDLVYLTFSTGMGGGIIANGRLIQGVTDAAGEIGHQTLDPDGPPCGCGKRGCFEAYVGGYNVAERLKEKIKRSGVRTRIVEKAGGDVEKVDTKAFVAAAREGDPFALEEWEVFTERLAQGIGNVIMTLNPAVVILGTIAVHEGEFVLEPLRRKLPRYVWPEPLRACRIVPSSLGDNIGNLAALAVAVSALQAQGPAAQRAATS